MRWSRRASYASNRMLEESFILEPCSAAYLASLLYEIGCGHSGDDFNDCEPGRRKGNEPVGEAWLFEETRR